jgi:hypothetical protein
LRSQKVLQQYDGAIRLRSATVDKRNLIDVKRRTYTSDTVKAAKTRDDMIKIGQDLCSALECVPGFTHDVRLQRLKGLFGDFQASATSLKTTEKDISTLSESLNRNDMELIRLDNILREHEEQWLRGLPPPILNPSPEADSFEHVVLDMDSDPPYAWEAESDVSETTDPLEHDYYDAIGDVGLAREHLYNLETDHLQELSMRAARQANHVHEPVPEPLFFEAYFRQRQNLILEYAEGKARVFKLYEKCKLESRDIEEPNLPPLDEQVLDHSNRIGKFPTSTAEGTLADATVVRRHIPIPRPVTTSRVQAWRISTAQGATVDFNSLDLEAPSDSQAYGIHHVDNIHPPVHQLSNLSNNHRNVGWRDLERVHNSGRRMARFQPNRPRRRYSAPASISLLRPDVNGRSSWELSRPNLRAFGSAQSFEISRRPASLTARKLNKN